VIVDSIGSRRIAVRYRDPITLDRKQDIIDDIYPYAFLREEEADLVKAVKKEEGFKGAYGERLTKVTLRDPFEVSDLKNKFSQTWEAQIPFTNRALIDSGKHYDFYKHRVWYVDLEWNDREEVTVATVYDNYMGKYLTWFVSPPGQNHPPLVRQLGDRVFNPPLKSFKTEKELLDDFFHVMMKKDPDVLTGWFFMGADMKVLFDACKRHNWNAGKRMSPHGSVRYQFDDYSQCIKGRITIDLMTVFCRLWRVKNGQLPGQSLKDVSQFVLQNDEKFDLEDGHDTYYTDLGRYIDYNIQDVALLPKLDKMLNCIDHFLNLQHIVQCDFITTPWVTRLATVLLLRDEKFDRRIPTKPQFPYEDYQGADIQEAVAGLYESVAIMDIRAMYHSNVVKYNISWETILNEKEGIFDTDAPTGALGRAMNLLTDLRNEYKANMKASTTKEEKVKWDSAQYATKSLVASLYGVCGDSRFGMYHPAVAAAITRTSRNTLGELRDKCIEWGCDVIYGHTDSVFVCVESPEAGMEMMNWINEEMAPIETEFEKYCERMLLKAKNRYAGKVTWTDGSYHEPDYYVKGIESKQARMPQVMKDAMNTTINSMLDGKSEQWVNDRLTNLIHDMVDGKVSLDDLKMKGKLKKDLKDYRTIAGSAAGAMWANTHLGKEYRKGSYFWVLLDNTGRFIAFDSIAELPKTVAIGYEVMIQRYIIEKVKPFYEIASWEMSQLHDAMKGRKTVEWL